MATILPKKSATRKPKSIIEQADAPIQFGVPSEPAAIPQGDRAEVLVAAEASFIDGPHATDPVVVKVISNPAEAIEPGDAATVAAAIAPVALDIQPVEFPSIEVAPVESADAAPVTTLEPTSTTATPEPKKGLSMDETTNTSGATTNAASMMNGAAETMKTAASDMQARGAAMMGDINGRAKSAMERGTKAVEDLVEFQKGNLEAMMTSGRVAGNGAQEIAKYSAEYGRSTIEKANATARQFATVKSPTEFFQLQGEIAKQMLDAMVAEGAKFTESYMKLMGEVAQPLSNRVAVAVDTAKTTMGNQG